MEVKNGTIGARKQTDPKAEGRERGGRGGLAQQEYMKIQTGASSAHRSYHGGRGNARSKAY